MRPSLSGRLNDWRYLAGIGLLVVLLGLGLGVGWGALRGGAMGGSGGQGGHAEHGGGVSSGTVDPAAAGVRIEWASEPARSTSITALQDR